MTKAIILGCGLIGSAMAADLAGESDFEVSVADVSTARLEGLKVDPAVKLIPRDLADPAAIRKLVADYDLVLGALPSRLGLAALRAVIESGKNYVDISFMKEDPLEYGDLATEHGVTAVVDCGVAPGLANMIIGHCAAGMARTERVEYYVGGLPRVRRWPYQYKAPFAPSDVIEEYTRPARSVENGRIVTKPALSDPELLDFPEAGTLEAFNTDGLRSLLHTVKADFMQEKTLRYPGHRDLMLVLRETGFFRKDRLPVNGVGISPFDVTSALLFPQWELAPQEDEFTIMRVVVQGRRADRRLRFTYDVYDEFDRRSGITSMARTTAYPCTAVARMIARGSFREPGVHPPERLGKITEIFTTVLAALRGYGISIRTTEEVLEDSEN